MPLSQETITLVRDHLTSLPATTHLTSRDLTAALTKDEESARALFSALPALAAALPECVSRGAAYKNRFGHTARPYLWHPPAASAATTISDATAAALLRLEAKLDALADTLYHIEIRLFEGEI
jgi:hypothetical protein